MYQLAIFDLDGTLADTIADLANAVNHSLLAMHFPTHPVDAYRHFVGNGVRRLCERALPADASPEDAEQLLSLFQTYYEAHCLEYTHPFAGMPEVLDQLRSQGILLAVATNKPQPFSETIVHTLFGQDRFCKILGSCEHRPRKPAPDILQELMEFCQASPEQTVLIGDSEIDIETADHAGVDSIGCTWGFREKAELQQAGALRLANAPLDLMQFFQ